MIFSVIIFILTLLVLVLIHELGHFLVAKKFGIKVLEFGFGIPPRAWGKKVGETLVSINWLPFGGFVRLMGEDEAGNPKTGNDFRAKPVSQRILVVLAGVLMNLLLAWIIFYITLFANGFKVEFPLFLDHKFQGVTQENQGVVFVSGVLEDSPAEKAGISKGVEIVAVDGEPIMSARDLVEKTKQFEEKGMPLTFKDQKGNLETKVVSPRKNPPAGQGSLGLELSGISFANLEYSGVARFLAGPVHSWNIIAYSGKILGNLGEQSIRSGSWGPVSESVSGPVGVSSAVNDILTSSKNPLLSYLDFVAILSLNLAVFNVLPIPALDGGRLFFLSIEGIIRRKVKAEIEHFIHTVGLAILLSLMLLVTFSDLKKLFP